MLQQVIDPSDPVYEFDGFTLDPSRRSLSRHGQDVALGSRALELLVALVERAGDVLNRDYLTARVWPRTVVEESSLRVHMAALRRALGDGPQARRCIVTVAGRGYSFVADVTLRPRASPPVPSAPSTHGAQLPPLPTALLGRDSAFATLARLLQGHRLVTVVGPGGVGKTSLALHGTATGGHAPRFVDLASAACEADVVQSLAAAVGAPPSANSWATTLSLLRPSAGLLIVDGCEQMIDTAARLIGALLVQAPELRLLATSQEPLNVEGEQVYRLQALELPASRHTSIDAALQSTAVRLLVERARASGNDVVFEDADAADLCELARQLDGLPLALELGAARVRALGLKNMLGRLEDLNTFLTRGRRTALPRHRSLDATIGRSCELLSEAERRVLHALSAFPGSFSLASAVRVAASAGARDGGIEEMVLRLVEKSLVLASASAPQAGFVTDARRYHLANTTRRHAARQLRASGGEAGRVNARHALDVLRRLDAPPCDRDPASATVGDQRPCVEELRQALRWCFSGADGADERLGARILRSGRALVREQGLEDGFQAFIERARALSDGADLAGFRTSERAQLAQ